MAQAIATTDHETIRRWAEARDGHPAIELFETFDQNNLAFLYQDKTAAGRKSRFAKFVDRDSVAARSAGGSSDQA